MSRRASVGWTCGLLVLLVAGEARAAREAPESPRREARASEAGADSAGVPEVEDEIVVSAAKLPVYRSEVAASVTLLSGDEITRTASQTLPELLARGAGLHTYDLGGNGLRATAESRGFAAFGETSYLRFLVDGIPFADLAEDNAIWNLFDLDQLDRVEVIRSASSSLHGNTAFTGVVNLVPISVARPWAVRTKLAGGSYERREGTFTGGWRHPRSSGTASFHYRTMDGWRANSEWEGQSGFVTLASADEARARARLGVFHYDVDAELPGAIPEDLVESSPETAGTPLDRDDTQRLHIVGVYESTEGQPTPYSASVFYQTEDKELTETIFEQTQREDRETYSWGGQANARLGTRVGSMETRLLIGAEASSGKMSSGFRGVLEDGSYGPQTTDADVRRDAVAGFVELSVDPVPDVTLSVGVRRDDIWSELDPTARDSSGAEASDKVMNAWSPSASVNVRLADRGNAYVQVSRSFKTPTLTQLYELRPFFVFDPGSGMFFPISISNTALDPQRATQVELGVRGRLTPWLRGDLAVYTMTAEDEIGFDLGTFSYANIGESIHRGLEAQLVATPISGLTLDAGYALTIAEFDGDFGGSDVDGNQINNVPKHLLSGGITYASRHFEVGGSVNDVREQWADEGNTVEIPDYTVVNLHGSVFLADQELYARVRNVTDESYSPAGFVTLDPMTGGPLPLFYPAPGRTLEIGLRVAID